jgi:hypothetical protein
MAERRLIAAAQAIGLELLGLPYPAAGWGEPRVLSSAEGRLLAPNRHSAIVGLWARGLGLSDRREIVRAGIDSDAGHQHRQLEML